jgi:hypothetical protein
LAVARKAQFVGQLGQQTRPIGGRLRADRF